MSIELILNGVQQGLILAIISFGIMIPFRFLDFSDMTAEGAYPLGGAICAVCVSSGISPSFSIFLGMFFAGLTGACTALINLNFKVNSMLAGIILSTMAYSVNLRIMGKPNISLFDCQSITSSDISVNIALLGLIAIICIVPFLLFLRTDFGLRFRAVGLNRNFSAFQGISVEKYTIFGLFLAGIFYGLAGSLVVQVQNYADIGMGTGILIHGLAALMIGEALVGNFSLVRQVSAPIIGALIYQQIQGVALAFGLAPSDLKFFTGLIVLAVLALKKRK